jgi:hypothetical protein
MSFNCCLSFSGEFQLCVASSVWYLIGESFTNFDAFGSLHVRIIV